MAGPHGRLARVSAEQRALRIAAIRETFEETGLLVSLRPAAGNAVPKPRQGRAKPCAPASWTFSALCSKRRSFWTCRGLSLRELDHARVHAEAVRYSLLHRGRLFRTTSRFRWFGHDPCRMDGSSRDPSARLEQRAYLGVPHAAQPSDAGRQRIGRVALTRLVSASLCPCNPGSNGACRARY